MKQSAETLGEIRPAFFCFPPHQRINSLHTIKAENFLIFWDKSVFPVEV